MTQTTLFIAFPLERAVVPGDVGAAVSLGGISGTHTLALDHAGIRARLTFHVWDGVTVLDGSFTSGSVDVTRHPWPLEAAAELFGRLGGRLGRLGSDDMERLTDLARLGRLDVWWREGALLVDGELAALARSFRAGWPEDALWTERPLGDAGAALVLPGWFAAGGERVTGHALTPFHQYVPAIHRDEGRFDAVTITGFGRTAPQDVLAAVRRLLAAGATWGLALEPAPCGLPREAFAAGCLNTTRSHFMAALGEGIRWSDADRDFVRGLLDRPLAAALDPDVFTRLVFLYTGAVYFRSDAGPLTLFWALEPDRVCLVSPLEEEIYTGYVMPPALVRVAETFLDALDLDWGAASAGYNGALTRGSWRDAAALEPVAWVRPPR